MNKDEQILKCRDDKDIVRLKNIPGSGGAADKYKFLDDSWMAKDSEVDAGEIRKQLEPWLTSLFQSDHLSLLAGSGLTHAVYNKATGKSLPGMNKAKFNVLENAINAEADKSAKAAGRESGNIEDQLRVANELLRGLQILIPAYKDIEAKANTLAADIDRILGDFAESILKGEYGIITAAAEKREEAFELLVSFLMSFASRTGTKDRLQVFTTNYDRLIEAGSEAAGLHLLDRFVGSLAPIFRSSRLDVDMHYNPPGIRGEPRYVEGVARFSKLHGSVDWLSLSNNIRRIALPFGAEVIDPYLKIMGSSGIDVSRLMVYPNSAKDRETASYPYVELFRDFAAAICRPNSVLVCYGYSFGDEHINRVIGDMLTIPSTHLIVISYDDPLDRIINSYEQFGRHPQITLMLGDHFGSLECLVENYLPKPAIDRATFHMFEILAARWHPGKAPVAPSSAGTTT